MSPPSALNESPTPTDAESHRRDDSLPAGLDRTLRSLKAPAQFVCFWAAVALPVLLVSLLAYGIDRGPTATAFLLLLAVNVVALVVGHGYNQE